MTDYLHVSVTLILFKMPLQNH